MRRLLLALAVFILCPPTAEAAWVWPVKGEVITPYSNGTDPYAAGQHRGIDIAASVGTPVVAAADGEVRFAGTAGTSGLTISIRTGDGYDTSYLHLSSLAVRAGARVSTGDRIGAVGATGTRSATAPHLHFGVRDAGTRHAYHDPLAFLPPPPVAPEPRPPAPAPALAPEPAGPAPTPAPAPARQPVATGAPTPRSAPVSRATLGPRLVPHTKDAPAPTPLPAPAASVPAPRNEPGRGGVSNEGSHQSSAPRGVPRDVARGSTAATARPPHPAPLGNGLPSGTKQAPLARHRDGGTAPGGGAGHESAGPDIGWALACGGLLLAAAILGLTGDKCAASARRARIAETLRPLAGRR